MHPGRGVQRVGGVRGGRDQFSWEDVKTDKHREFYLGNSLKAVVGRANKDRDFQWYTRAPTSVEAARAAAEEERRRVAEYEKEARLAALGLAPKKADAAPQIAPGELKEILRRGATERDAVQAAERTAGLGFGPAPKHEATLVAAAEARAHPPSEPAPSALPELGPPRLERAEGAAAAREETPREPTRRRSAERGRDRDKERRKRERKSKRKRRRASRSPSPSSSSSSSRSRSRSRSRTRRRRKSRSRSRSPRAPPERN